ncbi:CotY/CotZ family spore coat protein [Paucisalibacillus sp. EB02]|uniref:CotY/CotZ family spore coat protein n=1 Tax=Paucisalibacillus sp. EB02 TaxID=1347087 RepID=UPI0004AFEDE7|nr:CotY/CotZ family spore coat protein [Paucisalibacillus sp. EB02]
MDSSHKCTKGKGCIKDTLKEILEAQQKVQWSHDVACDEIDKLLHPDHGKKNLKNTVPFILYTKEGCPFKADGVTTFDCKCCNSEKFKCISTFIFRLSGLKEDCAILELLTFKHDQKCSPSSPCDQLDCEKVEDLIRTGICIKIDLDCLCSIFCLPAVHLDPRKT